MALSFVLELQIIFEDLGCLGFSNSSNGNRDTGVLEFNFRVTLVRCLKLEHNWMSKNDNDSENFSKLVLKWLKQANIKPRE